MRRRTIRVRTHVRVRRHVRLRPVVTYVQPVPFIGEPGPSMTDIAGLECDEHAQHPVIQVDQEGTHVEACCEPFQARIEALLA